MFFYIIIKVNFHQIDPIQSFVTKKYLKYYQLINFYLFYKYKGLLFKNYFLIIKKEIYFILLLL
jgi:hypothetical protein